MRFTAVAGARVSFLRRPIEDLTGSALSPYRRIGVFVIDNDINENPPRLTALQEKIKKRYLLGHQIKLFRADFIESACLAFFFKRNQYLSASGQEIGH